MATEDLQALELQELVALIYDDWETINPTAASYLNALDVWDCERMSDPVGNETAATQVRYFLANASGWRGDVARAAKAELERRLDAA